MPLPDLELARLTRLRDRFLTAGGASGRVADYWRDAEDLAHYDAVFAQRIGWKWDAVLDEIRARGGLPERVETVVDWGCGTGIASRRVASAVGVGRVLLHDRSAAALDFALAAHEAAGQEVARGADHRDADIDLLVVSHLLDELDGRGRGHVLELARRSRRVWWVEPGTRAVSRALGRVRAELLDAFAVVAPCGHGGACPVFAADDVPDDRDGHWCHFFAAPPAEVFQDADWVKLARTVGIDLRALPYTFLALSAPSTAPPAPAPGPRLLGRPQVSTKTAHAWTCDGERGLVRHEVVKTRDRPRYRALKKGGSRWLADG